MGMLETVSCSYVLFFLYSIQNIAHVKLDPAWVQFICLYTLPTFSPTATHPGLPDLNIPVSL